MMHRIKKLFKIGRLISSDDSGKLRFGTFKYQGRTKDVKGNIFTPYGLMHNPPDNSMALMWSQNGQESNPITIVDDPNNRILKNLAKGEVAVGNYLSGSYIHFKANGDILINNVNGSTSILVKTNEIVMTATQVTVVGDLRATGDIIDNHLVNTNNLGDMRGIYNIHEHDENDSGGPTDEPNEQM